MNTNMLNIVNRIVAEQGEGILTDAKRLFPYFSDYAKNENKEERVAFGRCIEMGAYQELKKTRAPDERQRVKATLATQMNAKTGVARPRCVDALDLLEAVLFKPARQPSPPQPQYPPQQVYPPQPQYPPQGTSPAVKKTKTKKRVWVGIAAAVVVVVLVVNYCFNRPSVQPEYTPGTVSPQPSAAAPSSGETAPAPAPSAPSSEETVIAPPPPAQVEPRPGSQILFDNVILQYAQEFDRAQNELQESVLRKNRKNAIAALNMGTYIEDWVGTIDDLGTNTEGKAYIKIRLSRNLNVKTWNNALSDMFSNTLIEMDSKLYQVLYNLKKGQRVKFSGSLFRSDDDFYKETSMTIWGAMTDSDFLLRFTDIEPL